MCLCLFSVSFGMVLLANMYISSIGGLKALLAHMLDWGKERLQDGDRHHVAMTHP